MPLQLSSAQSQNVVIDAVEINSFAVDLDNMQLHISYDEGTLDTTVTPNAFIPVNKDKILSIGGTDFQDALALADTKANAMPVGSVSVYTALKEALYDKLQQFTGLTGTIV